MAPTLPLEDVRSLEQAMGETITTQRLSAGLLSAFALLALVLAALGVYGVTAYGVAQRTQEVGIRMSCGATPRAILRMLVFEGVIVAIAGLSIGLAGTLALTRFLQGVLYQVNAHDPRFLGGAALFLGVVAVVACGVPALRATRVDPVAALRSE